MPEGRLAISAELRRAVLVEAGHRCAVPTCRQHPVDIEHISDWAKVKEHTFDNLIALCPTCHRRKGSGPDQIDRKSLRQYKANLAILNCRYGEVERRLIEFYAEQLARNPSARRDGYRFPIPLGVGSQWQVMYLVRDGYLERQPQPIGMAISGVPMMEVYEFTEAGDDFVQRWTQAQPLDLPGEG